jgi:ABC-2 type transport system permease protein
MTTLVRVELLKLKTIRMTYGLLIAGAGVTALFALLEASNSGNSVPSVATAAGLRDVTTASGMAMIFTAVLGVIVTSGEFRHTTATLTYLTSPDRRRVLGAKMIAGALVGFVYGVIGGVAATVVGLVYTSSQGDHVHVSAAPLVGHIAGAGAGAALLTALGVAVGALIRSQLAGVIGTLVWCMVLESILGGNVKSIRPYLPYTVASTLGGAKLGAAAFGPGYSVSSQAPLPFVGGLALLVATVAVIALIAVRTTVRKDIT